MVRLTVTILVVAVLSMACNDKTNPTTQTAPPAPKVEEGTPAEPAPSTAADPEKADVTAKVEQKDVAPQQPVKTEQERRRDRISEIHMLGRSKDPADAAKLAQIIFGEFESFEKATAIRALGDNKRDDLLPKLKELADDKDMAVRSEATITLYRWGEKEFSKPKLEKLMSEGLALRRAFFKGMKDGKFLYDEDAEAFFTKGLTSQQPHVRLDAALGLLHLGKTDVAVKVFQEALAEADKEPTRLTAVSYLASAKDMPEARALLEQAAKDPSQKVASRAKQILGFPPAGGAQPNAVPVAPKPTVPPTGAVAPVPATPGAAQPTTAPAATAPATGTQPVAPAAGATPTTAPATATPPAAVK